MTTPRINPVFPYDDALLLGSLQRELNHRIDALRAGTPVDPESIPDLARSIASVAARVALALTVAAETPMDRAA
ncbi:MAG: hypothetical protein IT337_13690 [Thermomicrobiales bacterium]|nr:hypothetical protein [Thermomicrobiales bacterium]